jgi:hypothetical protein
MLRIAVAVAHTVGGEPVNVRGVRKPSPIAAKKVGPQLIGEEEDDVRLFWHEGCSLLSS